MNDQKGAQGATPTRGARRGGALLVLAFATVVAPGAIAGCSNNAAATPGWTSQPVAMTPATVAASGTAMTAEMQTAWANRPTYVRQDARIQEAYAFAMASPAVLMWMPCYCGCEAMGHGSNLDCFFKPTMAGLSGIRFEEHASYCDICVDTALMAKRMAGEGQSLRAIRDAIDAQFGGAAPGTNTELPPA
jgi:hypothetical protein